MKEKVPLAFTVDASGKQVKFAPGNLYWDGTQFKFEAHQYDYPTSRDASHVGHFFYSKTASVAHAASYSDSDASTSDTFFAADGGAIEGYTVLDKDEWKYLIDNAIVKKDVTIDGRHCTVLRPDGFGGTVKDSYTAEEWANAESEAGLVALPFAGDYNGSSVSDAGSCGVYWSCTPDSDIAGRAYFANFISGDVRTISYSRNGGYSVRLVSVQ